MESEHVHESAAAEGIPADEVDGSFAPMPRPEAVAVEFDGETVLVDAVHMEAHRLDRVGTIVWGCFDGASSIDELSADLSDAFGAPLEAVREDVLALVRDLGRAGLLAGVEPRHAHAPATPTGLPVGTELADVEGNDLSGREARLSSWRGRQVVLVNWSPSCGFCRRVAPLLAEAGELLRDRGVEPVLWAMGGVEANRELLAEHGVDVTVLLRPDEPSEDDPFPGLGTPVAYLLDEDGKVAAPLSFGADQVADLVRELAGLEAESA